MSRLVEHARTELALLGEDSEYAASLLAAVEGFASFDGHSGGSYLIGVEQLHALLQFRNLTPLTDDPAEWQDRSQETGQPMWQSRRNLEAFSTDGGRTYTLLYERGNVHTSVPAQRPSAPPDSPGTS